MDALSKMRELLEDSVRGAVAKVFADGIRSAEGWPETRARMKMADEIVKLSAKALLPALEEELKRGKLRD